MIIYLIGQPCSGKTTLAKELKKYFEFVYPSGINERTIEWIDGDDLRLVFDNTDYSIQGRRLNIERAHTIAKYLDTRSKCVILSLVSPFRNLREQLKNDKKHKVYEIYLHSSKRIREGKMVDYYEKPESNYLDIDTDNLNINESLTLISKYLSNIE